MQTKRKWKQIFFVTHTIVSLCSPSKNHWGCSGSAYSVKSETLELLQEIRAGCPDGFNVTTCLWNRCNVEIWSKNKHVEAKSSMRATAVTLCGIQSFKQDEKHIATYIFLPARTPLSLCGSSQRSQCNRHFCVSLNSKHKKNIQTPTHRRRIKRQCPSDSYHLCKWWLGCCGQFGVWNRSWWGPGALQSSTHTPGGLKTHNTLDYCASFTPLSQLSSSAQKVIWSERIKRHCPAVRDKKIYLSSEVYVCFPSILTFHSLRTAKTGSSEDTQNKTRTLVAQY